MDQSLLAAKETSEVKEKRKKPFRFRFSGRPQSKAMQLSVASQYSRMDQTRPQSTPEMPADPFQYASVLGDSTSLKQESIEIEGEPNEASDVYYPQPQYRPVSVGDSDSDGQSEEAGGRHRHVRLHVPEQAESLRRLGKRTIKQSSGKGFTIGVRNWPASCPIVHLDFQQDFELDGHRSFVKSAMGFYWLMLLALGQNAIANIISAMTTPVGGSPFIMSVGFLGFSLGYFILFGHFYLIYLAVRFDKGWLYLFYFLCTMVLLMFAVYMMLKSVSDVMLLSQPVAPGSPVPIPIDISLAMSMAVASAVIWFVVIMFAVLLIQRTYFWSNVSDESKQQMINDQFDRQHKGQLPPDPEATGYTRSGSGVPCELVLRYGELHVPGKVLLSPSFLHFCADGRVFDLQLSRVISVENITGLQHIAELNKNQLRFTCRGSITEVVLQFELASTTRKVYQDCRSLYTTPPHDANSVWIWNDPTAHPGMPYAADFDTDPSLLSKLASHKNRARERYFSAMPTTPVTIDQFISAPSHIIGDADGAPPLWEFFTAHRLSQEHWEALLGGVTLNVIDPGHTFLHEDRDHDMWHICSGTVQLVEESTGRIIASAGDNAIIGLSQFLDWSLEELHRSAHSDADSGDMGAMRSEPGSDQLTAKTGDSKWEEKGEDEDGDGASMADTEPLSPAPSIPAPLPGYFWRASESEGVTAYRLSHEWLATALSRNPSLRGPMYSFLGTTLAERHTHTARMIADRAERDVYSTKGGWQESLSRALDGTPIPHDEAQGFAQRTADQRKYTTLFQLPSSETFIQYYDCTSFAAVVCGTQVPVPRSGRLLLSLHHVCFEAPPTMLLPHERWTVSFDEIVDIRSDEDVRGIELVLRESRHVTIYRLDNVSSVMEMMVFLWKDTDLATSFKVYVPPLLRIPFADVTAPQPLVDLSPPSSTGPDGRSYLDKEDHSTMGSESVEPESPEPPAPLSLPPPDTAPAHPILSSQAPTPTPPPEAPKKKSMFSFGKKGYEQLQEEEEGVRVEAEPGEVIDTAAWLTLSKMDKHFLFSECTPVHFGRNQIILSESIFNPNSPGIFLVESGLVRVQLMVAGRTSRVLLEDQGPGSILGAHELLTCTAPAVTYVVSSDRAVLRFIDARSLLHKLRRANFSFLGRFYRELTLSQHRTATTVLFHGWDAHIY